MLPLESARSGGRRQVSRIKCKDAVISRILATVYTLPGYAASLANLPALSGTAGVSRQPTQ